jgi:peptidoglycan-N-acetylglucosamine deacetylase
MFKYTITQLLQFFTPSLLWRVKTVGKTVYLTFDDGPHPQITPWVLNQLKLSNAQATFFCVGENVTKFPDTFNEILNSGNEVGNHTFNHINGWKTNNENYFNNILKCKNVVDSNLFRPPYGRIKFSQIKMLKQHFQIIMWDILSRDYEANLDTKKAIQKIKNNLHNGSIIVFHDSAKAEKNLKLMLPEILQHIQENGYEMKSL